LGAARRGEHRNTFVLRTAVRAGLGAARRGEHRNTFVLRTAVRAGLGRPGAALMPPPVRWA